MPCTIRKLTPSGLQPVDYTADSLQEAAEHEPDDGVYTVASTHDTYGVVKLTAHLNRLQDSARRENITLSLTHAQIRAAIREVIDIADYGNVKFRVTVPRQHADEIIISVEPFGGYPARYYTGGVKVVTVSDYARRNPAAKDTHWMFDRRAIEDKLPADVHTAILLDAEGNLLEGTSSNFYAVLDNTLYTAVEGVLPGTAQQIVFEVAPDILPLVRRPANIRDLLHMQEAFITSSSRGVMPVTRIDNTPLGGAQPGAYTQAIRQAYLTWIAHHAEQL